VLKYRKIKTFQGNNFTVSSALVIKLKVVEWCLTAKNQWELISGDDGFGFMELVFLKRIGEARTKLMGIEENDNGQENGSMVN